jgi:hypothetical protein
MNKREKVVAGKTLAEWEEFSRRDDCLDRMVPSDLRLLVREAISQEEYAKGREKGLQQAAELCDTTKYYDFREKGAVASLGDEILSLLEDK